MTFYQITALYMGTDSSQGTVNPGFAGEEIAYAEGEDYSEVMRECAENIPALYPAENVTLKAISDSGVVSEVTTTLEVWLMLNGTDFINLRW